MAQRIAALSPEQREVLLRGLAQARQGGSRAPEAVLPPLVPRPEERYEPFPLTDVQQVYWAGRNGFFDLPTPGPGATVYMEYDVPGDETFAPAFERAFQRLFDRHEMLRAILLPDGRQQCLRDLPPWRVEQGDLRWLDPQEVEARLGESRERFRYQAGAVGQWPLFGFLFNVLDGGRLRLHAWFDAWLIDGLSRDNLVRDLMRILQDPDAALPPLGCTYRDYAMAWQELRQTDLYRQSRDYWLARVPSLPPPPELPLSQVPRPETPVRFTAHTFELLPADDWARFKAVAMRRGLTPTTPLLAAFAEVLRAWSRSPRFTLGLDGTYWPPIHPQLREIVGNFNTIHVVAFDEGGGTFSSRALGLQEQLSEALDHGLFSGHRVLREINRAHGGSPRALMPVLFNSLVEFSHPAHQSRNAPPSAGGGEGGPPPDIVQIEISANLPQMLLTVAVFQGQGGRLDVRFQTAEDFFPPGLNTALREAYSGLIARLAQDERAWEEDRFHFAPVLSTAAGDGHPAPDTPATLHALVAARAAASPEREAVAAPDRSLAYAELMQRADELSDRLRALGAGPGQPVAVLFERGWQQAVSLLGVLGSGAILLSLDAAAPPDELWPALRRAGARLAVTRAETGRRLEWPDDVRWLAADPEGIAPERLPRPAVEAEDAYAAGAAILGHRAAVSTVLELVRRLEITPADRLLSLSPPASDLALYEILAPLAAGAAVVLSAAGAGLESWIARASEAPATLWSGPPAVIDAVLSHFPAGTTPRPRQIALARGTVAAGLPARLRQWAPAARIVALRGFPEAAGVSAIAEVDEHEAGAVRAPSGEPFPGHHLRVLDSELEPRPDWVPGDLYVAGPCLGRPWEAAASAGVRAFHDGPNSGERLLRTGSVGRSLPGGRVEILEREEDFAAEIAGAPVELRPIEAALERLPTVRAAVVRPWTDPRGRRRLAAWVVAAPGADVDARALATQLRRDFPAYLVPAWFQEIPALPLDAAGEIDRAALPPIDGSRRHPREPELAALWAEVLGQPGPIAATDDFFALGGDSFSASRMLVHLRERFGRGVDLAAFFEEPTLRHLAGLIGQEPAAVPEPPARTESPAAAVPSARPAAPTVPLWERWMSRMLPPTLNRGMHSFLLIWLGQFVSAVGTGLGSFALGVWLYEKTQSATSFAMIGFLAGTVIIVMSPIAGGLVDRMDRRKLLLISDLGSGLVTLLMAFLLLSGLLRPWHVYPLIAVMVTFVALQSPALSASVAMLVPRSQLARASGMTQTSRSLAQIIGPLSAGALVGRIGYHGVMLIDCATFFFALGTLLLVRIPLPPRAGERERGSMLATLTFGWTYLRRMPGLFSLLRLYAMTNFCMGMVQALLTPLILSFATPVELGSVSSAGATGALLGGLTLAIWGGPRRRMLGIFVLLTVEALLLALCGAQASIGLIAPVAFAFMFTLPFVNGINQAILQSKVAPEVQGRVFAVAGMITAASMPAAALIAGPLADRIFEPLLAPGGALAGTAGRLIGVGDGRGVGFLFILLGAMVLVVVSLAALNPRLRRLESEIPDALLERDPMPSPGGGRSLQNA